MTPAAVLDKLLPRWRAKLPPRFSPEFIDGFITRNRSALEAVVSRAMMLRGVKRGASPGTPEAFAAYGRLVQRERALPNRKAPGLDSRAFQQVVDPCQQFFGLEGFAQVGIRAVLKAFNSVL